MKKNGFDHHQYVAMQSEHIRSRISKFGGKLYLEFGGKLFDDYHASRVLPGFEPDSKINMLLKLHDQAEVVIVINASDIEKNKVRGDLGITYDADALRLIDALKSVGLCVSGLVITQYRAQPVVQAFQRKLKSLGIKVYRHYPILNYPSDIALIVSDQGYGKNEYVQTERPLVIVTAPGPGSGKMAVCLSQLYHESKRGVQAGYAKFETFPIWNLPLRHPVNIAYEAATADLNDVNMIDPYHLEEYGTTAVNYNRDVEIFPVLNAIFEKIAGCSPYHSPTDMGVNMAGSCIIDDEVCRDAAKQEIIRRYYASLCRSKQENTDDEESKKILLLMQQVSLSTDDREVVAAALDREGKTGEPAAAIKLPDGEIITGKTSPLLGASAALLLNALKRLGGIEKDKHLISPGIIEPIQDLKVTHLGNHNPRLHTDEVLLALSICASSDENAELAMQQLEKLSGLDVHSSVLLSQVDETTFRKLGINLTCEPKYQTKNLFHKR